MGREWNERLSRRLQDSICMASDANRAGKILVTDLRDSSQSLIEVLDVSGKKVIGEFLITPRSRPTSLRYREECGWPEIES